MGGTYLVLTFGLYSVLVSLVVLITSGPKTLLVLVQPALVFLMGRPKSGAFIVNRWVLFSVVIRNLLIGTSTRDVNGDQYWAM